MANNYVEKLSPMRLSASKSYEPARTNHFSLEIFDLPGQGTREIMLAVSETSMPTISTGVLDVGFGNAKVHFPGKAEFGGLDSLVVIDYITTDIEKIVSTWHRQVYDPTTDTIGWAANYKKSGKLTEFAPDGTNERVWQIDGIWPSSVSYGGSLSMDGSEVKKITVTLSYDRAYRVS